MSQRLTLALALATLLAGATTSQHNFVEKCPSTDILDISAHAEQRELSLLFYYTSWCGQSRAAKQIYYEVASKFQQEIYFGAVDCWHLGCNCTAFALSAQGARRPMRWPVLVVHFQKDITLQYNGDWNVHALLRFINALSQPYERVNNREELQTIYTRSSAVVLGLFPRASGPEYNKFTKAAVKWLETDPERNFQFAVAFASAVIDILNRTIEAPLVVLTNEHRLELFNASAQWSATKIVRWAQTELRLSANNTYRHSMTSSMAYQMRFGPVLGVFATDEAIVSHYYSIIDAIKGTFEAVQRPLKHCTALARRLDHMKCYYLDHVASHTRVADSLCYNRPYLSVQNLRDYYQLNAYLDNVFLSFKRGQFSSAAASSLLDVLQQRQCLKYATKHHTLPIRTATAKFLKLTADQVWLHAWTSFRHPRTRKLSVFLYDAEKHRDFLNTNGIPYTTGVQASAVFIADPKLEQLYAMNASAFTFPELLLFVKQYYSRNELLLAHRRSEAMHNYTEYFQALPSARHAIYLQELNRQMFLNYIHAPSKTTVLLLHSPRCALSALMSHALLQVAAILNSNDINFTRLNALSNDLPWELVMPTSPTLLVFPRDRPQESRTFPVHLKADVRNLFAFIVAQLEPEEQVRTVLGTCKSSVQAERLQRCLRFAESLYTYHVGRNLKLWQLFVDERHHVLSRLKLYKRIDLQVQQNFML